MGWNKGGWGAQAEDPGVSKYNSGMLTNQRLHNLWLFCQKHWRSGELSNLNDCLDLVWVELFADSTKEQRETIANFDKSILELTKKSKELIKRKSAIDVANNKAMMALTIKDKFLFLKTVEKKQGRGLAYKDEFEDDFD